MNQPHRKVSVGTCVMLVLTLLVVIGTTMVLLRLSSGNQIDRSAARGYEGALSGESGKTSASQNGKSGKERNQNLLSASATSPSDTQAGSSRHFTLTVAGTVAVEYDILKNSYLSDVKTYDISDILTLLRSEIRSDVNIVFLENLLMSSKTDKNIVAPPAVASMIRNAGFNMVACGFTNMWRQKEQGITETRQILSDTGIEVLGIVDPEVDHNVRVTSYGGIRTAILHYSTTMGKNDRKNATSSGTVPPADAESIASDIADARTQGADLVIVLMNWGNKGKNPDKDQKKLAQQIADSGADLIIGNGSRMPQQAEYLSGSRGQVLCIWSLGVLLTAERKNNKQMAGYLFRTEFMMDSAGNIQMFSPSYTPLYTWMYKQDGRYYYRCLAANRQKPDGMENEQKKKLEQVANITREALKESPLSER